MARPSYDIGIQQLTRLLEAWSTGDGPLYVRLERELRTLILSGRVPVGVRLPSERSLGAALGLSRNTIASAFETLRGEGLLASRLGDGTYVIAGSGAHRRGDDRLHSFVAEPGDGPAIDLRSAAVPGLPLVAEQLASFDFGSIDQLVAGHGYLPAGLPALRERVAEYYRDSGMPTSADEVLITSGAQQAMRLAASAIVTPGSTVLVEEPTFRGAIESLRGLGAHVVPLPDPDDPDFDHRTASMIERFRPVLMVVQSTLNNPTGRVMTEAHKRRLAALAESAGAAMLDDATLADIVVDEVAVPPLSRFFGDLITVGSMSKSFWGGLRVGWVRADSATIAALASAKGGEDLGTSLVAQCVASELLPRIDEARRARRYVLGRARDQVLSALAEELPEWQPLRPAGGASLWVRLPEGSATAFAQQAERIGVRLLPGPTFSAADQLDDHIRVAFAGGLNDTVRAIRMLGALWRSVT